jgi:hypothetical protein
MEDIPPKKRSKRNGYRLPRLGLRGFLLLCILSFCLYEYFGQYLHFSQEYVEYRDFIQSEHCIDLPHTPIYSDLQQLCDAKRLYLTVPIYRRTTNYFKQHCLQSIEHLLNEQPFSKTFIQVSLYTVVLTASIGTFYVANQYLKGLKEREKTKRLELQYARPMHIDPFAMGYTRDMYRRSLPPHDNFSPSKLGYARFKPILE